MAAFEIRGATTDDIVAMQTVAVAANRRFRGHDDPRISERADDLPYATDALTRAIGEGRVWVALGDGADSDHVIGFSVGWTFNGEAHLDEVAVHPEHGRRGVGRALIDAVIEWALDRGLPSITLTTYRDVPWNRPYYERLGFTVVEPLSEPLQRLIDHQAQWGLIPELRVVMRRTLDRPA